MKSEQDTYPKELEKQNALLEAIRQMQNNYFKQGMNYGWCEDSLKNLLLLTDSKFGFICELLHKKDGTPYLKSHVITNIAWSDETRKFYKENKEEGLEFFNFDSIWGQVFKTGKPYISDDPDTDQNKGGYPKESGHPHLKKFLGIPIKGSDSEIIGIMAVANNPNGYNYEIVSFLEPFVSTYGILMEQERLKREEKKAEQELLFSKRIADENREKYFNMFNRVDDAIFIFNPIDYHILEANESTSKIYGYSQDELIGMSCLKFSAEVEKSKLAAENAKKKGKEVVEYRHHRKKNGTDVFVNLQAYKINFKGKDAMFAVSKDITYKVYAERALKESEEKLRNIFENGTNIFYSHTPEHVLTYLSPQVEDMIGYTQEEAMIKWTDLVSDNPINEIGFQHTVEAIKTGNRQPFYNLEIIKKSGEKIWVEVRETPVVENGKVVSIVGSISDVTERFQAERALKESEEKFRTIFNYSLVGISITDVDGTMNVNKTFCDILGYSDEELNLNFSKITYPDDVAISLEYFNDLKSGKINHANFEKRFFHKNGSIVWVEIIINLFKENGEPKYFITSILDITERKLVEEELQNKQLLLRTVIDNIPDAIFTKDLEYRNTLSNMAGTHNSGAKSESEVLGKTDFDLFPKEIAERFYTDDKSVIQKGSPLINREEFLFDENGQKRWILTSKIPLRNKDGQITGLVGIGRDITKRKQSETIIEKQNDELIKLNADKDRFISILGHDLRSPFNTLLGFSELLSKNSHEYDSNNIEELADNVHKSALSTFNLLDDLLNWTRAQQGNMPFEPTHPSLTDVVDDVLETLTPNAKGKSISINCQVEDKLKVFADRNMLRTVMRNLVSNAIKFTNKGGAININAEENPENVTVRIKDNGIGIPSDVLPKLFDVSEKITTAGTSGESGTSLGLLLCKEFVGKHGGRIWVESEEGKGSEFIFTLPTE